MFLNNYVSDIYNCLVCLLHELPVLVMLQEWQKIPVCAKGSEICTLVQELQKSLIVAFCIRMGSHGVNVLTPFQ